MIEAPGMEAGRVARQLALAVLQQAIADTHTARLTPGKTRGGSASRVTAAERAEAERFLRDLAGSWASARRAWCDMAGVEPAWLEWQMARARQ